MQNFWKKFVIVLTACAAVQMVGAAFTFTSLKDWYPLLNKPSFNPPAWIFGPVWTALYFLMALSGAIVWSSQHPEAGKAMRLFWIQLILNLAWSAFFFALKSPVLAFGEVVLLWLFIALTMKGFFKINPAAGWALAPYLLWVSFASILNYSIWRLNP